MKIGIITLYRNYNYGAVLQAFALQSVIKKKYPKCETINYIREINGIAQKNKPICIRSIANIWKSMRSNRSLDFLGYVYYQKKICIRNRLFDKFIEQNIAESKRIYVGHKNLKELNNCYDVFVAGSDNIWNKNLLDSAFFLEFVDNTRGKISYAAGMSYDSADTRTINFIRPLLDRFDFISIREPTGKRLVEDIIRKPTFQALDPTFLLTAEEWKRVETPVKINSSNGYILCFFIEPSELMIHEAKLIKRETGKSIVCLPFLHQKINPNEIAYADISMFDVGPGELISLIRQADFICTDSFHGTAFSIIFNKQFVCFRRFQDAKRSSLNLRMDHLLNRLSMPRRIIESPNEVKEFYSNQINYYPTNACIEKLRNDSIEFLFNGIKSFDKE